MVIQSGGNACSAEDAFMNDVMCQLVRQRKAQSAVAPFIFKKRRFDQHGAALHAHQGVVASVTVVVGSDAAIVNHSAKFTGIIG